MNKLRTVLARIDTGHLSKLWIFYRDYFKSDEACLDFIFDVVHNEPLSTTWQQDVDESLFIPRRMNCVERMVSTASDMELIRKGKDIFKIVLLVSCVETLQTLAGNKSMSKKEMQRKIERTNKYRSDFYYYHTGHKWTDARDYDLCLDSGKLGFEKCVEEIEAYAKIRFGK